MSSGRVLLRYLCYVNQWAKHSRTRGVWRAAAKWLGVFLLCHPFQPHAKKRTRAKCAYDLFREDFVKSKKCEGQSGRSVCFSNAVSLAFRALPVEEKHEYQARARQHSRETGDSASVEATHSAPSPAPDSHEIALWVDPVSTGRVRVPQDIDRGDVSVVCQRCIGCESSDRERHCRALAPSSATASRQQDPNVGAELVSMQRMVDIEDGRAFPIHPVRYLAWHASNPIPKCRALASFEQRHQNIPVGTNEVPKLVKYVELCGAAFCKGTASKRLLNFRERVLKTLAACVSKFMKTDKIKPTSIPLLQLMMCFEVRYRLDGADCQTLYYVGQVGDVSCKSGPNKAMKMFHTHEVPSTYYTMRPQMEALNLTDCKMTPVRRPPIRSLKNAAKQTVIYSQLALVRLTFGPRTKLLINSYRLHWRNLTYRQSFFLLPLTNTRKERTMMV